MSRIARALALGTTLALALVLLAGNAKAFFLSPDMKKDLDALAEAAQGGDAAKVKKMAGAMKTKQDELNEWMAVYKITKSKGVGWDPSKTGPAAGGLEKRMIELGTKKELSKADLAKEAPLILRAANYNIAMYHLTKEFAPDKPKAGKGAKDWNKHNEEMKEGSEEAIKAVKAGDPKALKKALGRVNAGCNECHTDFRN